MNNRLKVVFLTPTYTHQMSGYIGMALPKAMAKLGVDVYVISANLNVYYYLSEYKEIYEPLIGPAVTPCCEDVVDGYRLYRLPHCFYGGQLHLKGLLKKLRSINPDIVHVGAAISFLPLEAAFWSKLLGYKLFTAQHNSNSTFTLATKNELSFRDKVQNFLLRFLHGRLISFFTEKCYAPTPDCRAVAIRFMGVAANKCVLRPLGVDTELFKPIVSDTEKEKRLHMRTQLGFSPEDIICIYTGRLTHRKNPLCLAQAIELLAAKGLPFKAFFVGNGPQEEILRSFPKSCVVHPLVNYFDLPTYYQLADIAVWPVEYTTSMLEAAACGIPIVINENIQARERVEGNGMTYKENDPTDLARSLALLGDAERRKQLGQMGAQKMVDHFSWKAVAQRTLSDFEHATKLSAK